MIKLVIAVHGDNEDLARKHLAELLDHAESGALDGHFTLYRAWSERITQEEVEDEFGGPRELIRT